MENTMTLQGFTHSDGQWLVACVYLCSLFPCLILLNGQKAKTQTGVDVQDIRSCFTSTEMDFSSFTFTSVNKIQTKMKMCFLLKLCELKPSFECCNTAGQPHNKNIYYLIYILKLVADQMINKL